MVVPEQVLTVSYSPRRRRQINIPTAMGMFTGPEIDASSPPPTPSVARLLALYGDRNACAAHLLCDRHDPAAIAYTIVAPDLTSSSLSYGDLRRESERLAAGLHSLGV